MSYKYPLTVFTPTYNRKELLKRLYEDLKQQTFKDFEWVIVDDGSIDGTRETVGDWIEERVFPIQYIHKLNGGKHTAINVGVTNAKGKIFFLADSDDGIVPNGLQLLFQEWSNLSNKDEFCGITGLFKYTNGEIVGTKFNERYMEVPFVDLYNKYKITGDKVVCFTTDIMKKYPFPESEQVKFVMEAVVWDEISKNHKVKCINKIIQIKEYQEDGITKNSYSESTIKGLAFSYLTLINNNTYPISKYFNKRLWTYIHLVSNSLLGGVDYFSKINKTYDKFLYLLFFPRGFLAYLRMKKYIH